jgi:hypothetical protein
LAPLSENPAHRAVSFGRAVTFRYGRALLPPGRRRRACCEDSRRVSYCYRSCRELTTYTDLFKSTLRIRQANGFQPSTALTTFTASRCSQSTPDQTDFHGYLWVPPGTYQDRRKRLPHKGSAETPVTQAVELPSKLTVAYITYFGIHRTRACNDASALSRRYQYAA